MKTNCETHNKQGKNEQDQKMFDQWHPVTICDEFWMKGCAVNFNKMQNILWTKTQHI